MKRLYLAASIDRTGVAIAEDLRKETGKEIKDLKAVFINTASEGSTNPDRSWLADDRAGLDKGGFKLFDYTVTGKNVTQIDKDLSGCDVIHVDGGNSFYLLLQVKKSGFDKWIKNWIEKKDKVYIGSSAGTQILSPNMEILRKKDSRAYEKQLKNFKGNGIVDFVVFPHWGSEKFRDVYFQERLKRAYKPENKIILLNNWQFIKVKDDTYKIIDVRDK